MRFLLALLMGMAGCDGAAREPRTLQRAPVEGLSLTLWKKDLSQPLALVPAPGDERLFIVEKTGRIQVIQNGKREPSPLLDLSTRVSDGYEQGLLGLAFHPDFAQNGRYFVNYTDLQGDTHVSEFGPGGEKDWQVIDQPYANHNGGHLLFGPDGLLYIGTGDGGAAFDPHGNAQNPRVLLGKMLTLDVNQPNAKPQIVQNGLRNPWRYAFDPATRDLYLADVGQNRYEEVNVIPFARIKGQNLGWDRVEGMGHCVEKAPCDAERYWPPVVEYAHDQGCSITGGLVYRGKNIPALNGHYFYADFCTGLIHSFRYTGGQVRDLTDWSDTLNPGRRIKNISSFGTDHAGELYVLSLDGGIYRLTSSR